ncbi:MAG TPA: LuxR C-terminal-related transcriptional regulator [Candidatus Limnocylindria bacterium]|jgi:DNA-binding CsgD family transcriptional regulator
MAAEGDHPGLTERQLEVVQLVARGFANKQIAGALSISERAVEATLTRVYERLDVANRSALIALALSERGFGLAVARRTRQPSELGALGAPRSLEEEARAYEGAPFMVAVSQGPEHRYTFVNRIAAEVAGRAADSLVGRTVREIYPDLDPAFGSALDEAYRMGRPWSSGVATPVRWTHEDGSVRDSRVNVIFQPLRDASGAVVGLLHIGAEEGTRT